MQFSDWVSLSALGVSLLGFGVAVRSAFYDRPRLSVSAEYVDESEYGQARISIAVVNKGRRPAILRLAGGRDKAGEWGGTFLDQENGGKRLGEHERYDYKITKEDTVILGPDRDLILHELWIEDSLGVRYIVPKSREYVRRLRAPSAA